MLPALAGDCLVLKVHRDNTHQMIIVDGGMGIHCTSALLDEITEWNREFGSVDLVILTHIDNDHINGLINIFRNDIINSSSINKVMFNYGVKFEEYFDSKQSISIQVPNDSLYTSFRQGRELLELLDERNIELIAPVMAGNRIVIDENLYIDILAPLEKELRALLETSRYKNTINNDELETSAVKNDYDYTVEELNGRVFSERGVTITNASSIACLLSYFGHKILLLGDAKASTIEDGLRQLGASENNPLKIDYYKISHHGSKFSTSSSIIRIIDCEKYLLSTNWTSGKPSKECLSRIIMNTNGPVQFLCNYESHQEIFTKYEYDKYKMALIDNIDRELIIYESNC